MSHTMKLWESDCASLESDECPPKPIWFYAREIDYRGDLLATQLMARYRD